MKVAASPEAVRAVAWSKTVDAPAPAPYFPPGQLTRLPSPAAEIDFSVTEIALLPFRGAVDFTLFLDPKGRVADVAYPLSDEEGLAFAQAVAERLRRVPFRPGEIDGRPVAAELTIRVVSEEMSVLVAPPAQVQAPDKPSPALQ